MRGETTEKKINKALIPQCVHCILPREFAETPISLQISSLKALVVIIRECSFRIHAYKGIIIEGVGKCWVTHFDKDTDEGEFRTFLVMAV